MYFLFYSNLDFFSIDVLVVPANTEKNGYCMQGG